MSDPEQTWKRKGGLLSWGMEVPNDGNHTGADWLHHCATTFADQLNDFATIRTISWSTESGGEDAAELDVDGDSQAALHRLTTTTYPDLYQVVLRLDLNTIDLNHQPQRIDYGADVFLQDEPDLTDVAHLGHPVIPGTYYFISFDVDIYTWRTKGAIRDNLPLATLNAPILNRFLNRLETTFGCPFTHLDHTDYADQATHNGIILPGDATPRT